MNVKYPHITVELTGGNGNAHAIIAAVRKALRRARLGDEVIKQFTDEATSGDYDNVLQTCMRWVNVE